MDEIDRLKHLAKSIRINVLNMTFKAGVNGGHIGGAFSSADILSCLYGKILNIPSPTDQDRDRFILSKGHTAIAHYATLAECGFISLEDLETFEMPASDFSTHEMINIEKGIEISSGSLGYGLSISVGIALAAKCKHKKFKTYVLLGDGECNEGTVWEAAMAAAKFKLHNLIAIVDVNNQSLDGYNVMPIHNIKEVWQGFGWNTIEIDGNDIEELLSAFNNLSQNNPNVIIAHTIKVKGIPSIEGQDSWHHARLAEEQYKAFLAELENAI